VSNIYTKSNGGGKRLIEGKGVGQSEEGGEVNDPSFGEEKKGFVIVFYLKMKLTH